MSVLDTVSGLHEYAGRGAGTDAERRAAGWLAGEVSGPTRETTVETFWCRPNWALAHAWHVGLALAGSLVMVSHAAVGGVVTLVALAAVVLDGLTGRSPGRRLTLEHASQNVVSVPSADAGAGTRLIVTAPYDAGRCGLPYRAAVRRPLAVSRRAAAGGRLTFGWLGWTALAMAWLVAVAIVRDSQAASTAIAVAQLLPTVALVVELAALLALGGAPFGPAAGDDAGGVAVAVALVRALDVAPSPRLRVELVLTGAGDGSGIGLRHHLRAHRRRLRAGPTAVLGIAACGAGEPRWWLSDGPLWPVRYHARLRRLAQRAAALTAAAPTATARRDPGGQRPVGPTGHRGRGSAPALPARLAGLPALSLGCLDERGLAPRSHEASDVPAALEPGAPDRLLEFALTLVDALDAELATAVDDGASAVR